MRVVAGKASQGFTRVFVDDAPGGVIGIGMVAALVLVAAQAKLIHVAAGEAFGVAAVGGVAEGTLAFHDRLVFRDGAIRFGPESFMALETEILGVRRQQRRPIRGMGRMAGHALAFGDWWMGMGHLGGGGDVLVAGETKPGRGCVEAEGLFRGRAGGHMTRVASSLGHGRMRRLFQHSAVIRSVGIVARDALLGSDGIALVGRLQILHVVAGDAKFLGWTHQALGKFSYVVFMAGQAFAGGGWSMGVGGFYGRGDGLVARQAQRAILPEQQRFIF